MESRVKVGYQCKRTLLTFALVMFRIQTICSCCTAFHSKILHSMHPFVKEGDFFKLQHSMSGSLPGHSNHKLEPSLQIVSKPESS